MQAILLKAKQLERARESSRETVSLPTMAVNMPDISSRDQIRELGNEE